MIHTIAALTSEILIIASVLTPVILKIRKLSDGMKCQLRSEMLRIYYHNCESKTIRQYEYENFEYLYKAYTALHGNSFITKIWNEIQTWQVIS